MLGIGGGGDAVGSLAIARSLEARGLEAVVGGVAWERFAVDPHPGPRPLAEVRGPRRLGPHAALVDPQAGATTPEGVHFCESRLAGFLGKPTVLIDVTGGSPGAARGIRDAAEELECDLVVLVDIGGDAIATGSEPGLASPLCDAVMLAAGAQMAGEVSCAVGVLGAGCDGELRPAEVLERVAALARAGAWVGTVGVTPEQADEIERAAGVAVTEASLMVAYCARGEIGETAIRGGLRSVELGPAGALFFAFDAQRAGAELPLVRAVAGRDSIEAGREALAELGITTELDYERRRSEGP